MSTTSGPAAPSPSSTSTAECRPAPGGGRLGFPEGHPNFRGVLPPAIGPVSETLAAHDLVLVAGTDAPEYATHLLDVARAAQAQPTGLVMSGGVAMARASELEGRLMAILDTTRARQALTARAVVTVSLVTLGVGDLAAARSFYEGLGWHTNAAPDDDVVFFQAGGMVIARSRSITL